MAQFEQTISSKDIPLGYQQLTSLTASTALTVPADAKRALIQAEGQPVRWRDDGTAPTATVGIQIAVGETLPYTGNLAAFLVIETTPSAKLNVAYYG